MSDFLQTQICRLFELVTNGVGVRDHRYLDLLTLFIVEMLRLNESILR